MTRRGLIGSPERIVSLASSHNPLSGIQSRSLAPLLSCKPTTKAFSLTRSVYIHVARRAVGRAGEREKWDGDEALSWIFYRSRGLTSAWETKIFTFQSRAAVAADPISSSAYRRSSQIYGWIRAAPYFLLFLAPISADYAVMANILPAVKKKLHCSAAAATRDGTTRRAALNFARARRRLACELNFKRAPPVNCKFPSSGCRRRSRLCPVCAGKWGKCGLNFLFVPFLSPQSHGCRGIKCF